MPDNDLQIYTTANVDIRVYIETGPTLSGDSRKSVEKCVHNSGGDEYGKD